MRRSRAIGVPTMGMGGIGAHDGDATRRSVLDGPPCSNGRADAVPSVDGSSNMPTSWRLTTGVGIDETPARPISKPDMDMAMTRKPGNRAQTSRTVCMIRIGTLRSGVHGNGHAPFWNSDRRSDPPIDCNGTRPGRLAKLRTCMRCGDPPLNTLNTLSPQPVTVGL